MNAISAISLGLLAPAAFLIGFHSKADTGPGYYKPVPPPCNYEWTLPDGSKLCLDSAPDRFKQLFPDCPAPILRGNYEE